MKLREGVLKDVAALSVPLGMPVAIVEGSVREENGMVSVTAGGAKRLGTALQLEVVVQAYSAPADPVAPEASLWALLFIFVNGTRVAPGGTDFCVMKLRDGKWEMAGWEVDEFGEWEDLRRLCSSPR